METRNLRTKILVVCEGEETEPNYFKEFPVDKEIVSLEVAGTGMNTVRAVKEAARLRQTAIDANSPYNQVWCVFDRDDFPPANVNEAISLATQNRVRVAFSNQSFELWYLLHFGFHDAAQPRRRYREMLSERLGENYKKNDPNMYRLLFDKQSDAIRNAKTLLGRYIPPRPADDDPSTTVHWLVEELNRFIEPS
jgi:hypothetical protein